MLLLIPPPPPPPPPLPPPSPRRPPPPLPPRLTRFLAAGLSCPISPLADDDHTSLTELQLTRSFLTPPSPPSPPTAPSSRAAPRPATAPTAVRPGETMTPPPPPLHSSPSRNMRGRCSPLVPILLFRSVISRRSVDLRWSVKPRCSVKTRSGNTSVFP